MPFILPFLPAIIGGVSAAGQAGLFGGGGRGSEWGPYGDLKPQEILNILLTNQRDAQTEGRSRYTQQYDLLNQLFPNMAGQAGNLFFGSPEGGPGFPGLMGEMGQFQNQIPSLFRDSGLFWTPQQESAAGGMQGIGDISSQLFAGGGWTPQGQTIFDQLLGPYGIAGGENYPMNIMRDIGIGMFGNQGQTALTQMLPGAAMMGIYQGGQTPELQNLSQAGQQSLFGSYGVGGLTPTGAVGEGVGLEGLLQGGATPYTEYLQSVGADIAGRDPLLTMHQAMTMARDQAATEAKQQGEGLRRRALARGGGPGAVVASGLTNQAEADFADQIAQGQAGAMRDAMMKQQGLQLQGQDIATKMALGAGGLERERLGEFSSLLRGLEDTASRRFGIGGGLMSDSERIAADRMRILGELGLGGMRAEDTRMGTALQALNQYSGSRQSGLNAAIQALGQQNQYALGGGTLARGTWQDLMNSMLSSGRLGMDRASGISGAMNQLFGARTQGSNIGADLLSSLFNPWTSFAGQQGDMWAGPLRNEMGLFGPAAGAPQQPSFWSQLPGMLGGLGGLFGGGGGGGGTGMTPPLGPWPGMPNWT